MEYLKYKMSFLTGKFNVSRAKAKATSSQASASSFPQQTRGSADLEPSQSKNVNSQQKVRDHSNDSRHDW